MGAPGRCPERSQAVPFVAEETSQEKLLAHSRILHVEKRIGIRAERRAYLKLAADRLSAFKCDGICAGTRARVAAAAL